MALTIPNLKVKKLNGQIQEINQVVTDLYKVKKQVIIKLEETKQNIRSYSSPRNKGANNHKVLSIFTRDKTVSLLDRDISSIQNLHDVIAQDLEALKKSLESHIAIVEKTDLIMNILNYKIYDLQFIFRTQFDSLNGKKEKLTKESITTTQNAQIALQIVEIDDEVIKLEENHQKGLDSIKEQKIDAQREYERGVQAMDNNFEKMTSGFNKLLILIEAEKSLVSDSQSKLIDSKFSSEVERFKLDIDKYTELQTTGWKVIYPEEKISALLQEKGLKVSHSGLLITDDGFRMTFKEAEASRLFDNMTPEEIKKLKTNLRENGDDDSKSSKSESSTTRKISSEDVNYLKECLGKPLTLALAEITAVQPRDPIHYLGHWLFKYRYNQQMEDINNIEFEILNEQRTQIAKERWHKFIEEEARAAVIDMIIQAEETAILNELTRIQKEAEAMEEMENLDDEARDILGTYNGPQTGQLPLN